MKNLGTRINNWFEKLDGQWRAMPVKKQQRYTILLFISYALLSTIVILKVCYDVSKSDSSLIIEHIKKPVIQKNKSLVYPLDSLSTILKRRNYER
ncbi:nitrogen regulatory IIA protein [Gelidibacter sp. F2691]|nr:nitrogen regulatory IIA protein [Gelidibacter sp. F2691]